MMTLGGKKLFRQWTGIISATVGRGLAPGKTGRCLVVVFCSQHTQCATVRAEARILRLPDFLLMMTALIITSAM